VSIRTPHSVGVSQVPALRRFGRLRRRAASSLTSLCMDMCSDSLSRPLTGAALGAEASPQRSWGLDRKER
jgi:hypothetical protein